jgi:hypothetical protein
MYELIHDVKVSFSINHVASPIREGKKDLRTCNKIMEKIEEILLLRGESDSEKG